MNFHSDNVPDPNAPWPEAATVLVIEDDLVLGQVLGRILAREGHLVSHAQGAAQALDLLQDTRPQLIFLDTSLRDGKALELAQKLRADYAELPVILLTAQPNGASEFPGWSPDRVLSKSIDLPDLRRTVAAALAANQGRPSQTMTSPLPPVVEVPASFAASPPMQTPKTPGTAIVKESRMRFAQSKAVRVAGFVLLAVLILTGFAATNGSIRMPGAAAAKDQADPPASPPSDRLAAVKLVPGKPHTLLIPADVRQTLGIRRDNVDLLAVAKKPELTRSLVMSGSTMLDPTRIFRIRALFAPSPSSARVIGIGQVQEDPRLTGNGHTEYRELRTGDRVQKGDLLVSFYSDVVGSKKNDLINDILQLKLDEQLLKRWEASSAYIPDAQLWQQRKAVQNDKNEVDRAINTLRTWQIPEEDIQAILNEAESIHPEDAEKHPHNHTKADFDRWARVDIKAPDDGLIIERNVAMHEVVVDNTTNLFQITKLEPGEDGPRMYIMANCPEDDVPKIQALSTPQRKWIIDTVGSPPIKGLIDDVYQIIDPNQHTAVVKGHIINKEDRIRAGQFVRATVTLPAPKDVVEVPVDAVIDDGQQCIVFVQTDPKKEEYTMRRVELVNRFEKTVFVRSSPFTRQEELTPEEVELEMLPKQPLHRGERVLQSGVGELKSVLVDRETAQKAAQTAE